MKKKVRKFVTAEDHQNTMKLINNTLIMAFAISALAPVAVACGGDAVAERVDASLADAIAALGAGDYELALTLCNSVTESADTTSMTWGDYCRAATVYAAAYDHDIDTEASMASATRCLSRARAMQPDSVAPYIDGCMHEYSGALRTVMQTLDALNTDKSTIGDHEEGDFIDVDSLHVNHDHD